MIYTFITDSIQTEIEANNFDEAARKFSESESKWFPEFFGIDNCEDLFEAFGNIGDGASIMIMDEDFNVAMTGDFKIP